MGFEASCQPLVSQIAQGAARVRDSCRGALVATASVCFRLLDRQSALLEENRFLECGTSGSADHSGVWELPSCDVLGFATSFTIYTFIYIYMYISV